MNVSRVFAVVGILGMLSSFALTAGPPGLASAAGLGAAETQAVMDRLVAKVPEIGEMARKNPADKIVMQIEASPDAANAERTERDYYRIYVGFYVQDGGPGHRSRWATFLMHRSRDEILWVNYLSDNAYIPLEDWRKHIHNHEGSVKNDWRCLPFFRVGPIQPHSTVSDLVQMFGAANIERRTIYGAEGTEKFDVTVVFPKTANELLVFWDNNAYGQRPASVSIRKEGSAWKTVFGIGTGTSIAELNRINETPFSFFGFAWDYGGSIDREWGGGKLAAVDGVQLVLRETRELPRGFYGDKSLRSDDATLLPDGARVSRMQILLNK